MDPEKFLAFVHHADETAEAVGWGLALSRAWNSRNLGIVFHVHFSEEFHQQAVDEDVSAADAAQEDQVNAVVEQDAAVAMLQSFGVAFEDVEEFLDDGSVVPDNDSAILHVSIDGDTFIFKRGGRHPQRCARVSKPPAEGREAQSQHRQPRGVVIPGLWKDEAHYIKIRRPVKDDVLGKYIGAWNSKDSAPDMKFGGPRDGKSILFRIDWSAHLPVLILTEGEWDTMILWDHALDLCDAGTIGGAQSKFDLLDLALLTRYQKIFVVHDDDKAGDKRRAYIASLKAISPRIESITPPAHDLTDFWKSGGDLRKWVAVYVVSALQGTTHPIWMKLLTNAMRELREEE